MSPSLFPTPATVHRSGGPRRFSRDTSRNSAERRDLWSGLLQTSTSARKVQRPRIASSKELIWIRKHSSRTSARRVDGQGIFRCISMSFSLPCASLHCSAIVLQELPQIADPARFQRDAMAALATDLWRAASHLLAKPKYWHFSSYKILRAKPESWRASPLSKT